MIGGHEVRVVAGDAGDRRTSPPPAARRDRPRCGCRAPAISTSADRRQLGLGGQRRRTCGRSACRRSPHRCRRRSRSSACRAQARGAHSRCRSSTVMFAAPIRACRCPGGRRDDRETPWPTSCGWRCRSGSWSRAAGAQIIWARMRSTALGCRSAARSSASRSRSKASSRFSRQRPQACRGYNRGWRGAAARSPCAPGAPGTPWRRVRRRLRRAVATVIWRRPACRPGPGWSRRGTRIHRDQRHRRVAHQPGFDAARADDALDLGGLRQAPRSAASISATSGAGNARARADCMENDALSRALVLRRPCALTR